MRLSRKLPSNPVAEVPSNEEESSPVKGSGRSTPVTRDHGSSPETATGNAPATGDEGDHEGEDDDAHVDDMSSQDEISPYSTVNSVDNNAWYGEFVSQRFRSMSQSTLRRFSNPKIDQSRRRTGSLMRTCSGHKVPASGTTFPNLQIPDATNSSCDSEGSMSPTTANKGVANRHGLAHDQFGRKFLKMRMMTKL